MTFEYVMTVYIVPFGAFIFGTIYLIKGRERYSCILGKYVRVKDLYSKMFGILFLGMAVFLTIKNLTVA